jgi:hypothetical protein
MRRWDIETHKVWRALLLGIHNGRKASIDCKKDMADGLPDRLCGLVVRFPSYKLRSPGSIRGSTRVSDK